jgi:hypothetical protein
MNIIMEAIINKFNNEYVAKLDKKDKSKFTTYINLINSIIANPDYDFRDIDECLIDGKYIDYEVAMPYRVIILSMFETLEWKENWSTDLWLNLQTAYDELTLAGFE